MKNARKLLENMRDGVCSPDLRSFISGVVDRLNYSAMLHPNQEGRLIADLRDLEHQGEMNGRNSCVLATWINTCR
jgi:hypothetical protein